MMNNKYNKYSDALIQGSVIEIIACKVATILSQPVLGWLSCETTLVLDATESPALFTPSVKHV